MSEISAMPAGIVAFLKGRQELEDISFYTEYPNVKKAVPLKKITVAVGFEKMEITDSFEANDSGVLNENEYCRQALITLRFTIHAPFSMGGNACNEAYADIVNCLCFDSALEIIEMGCKGISQDRETDAFVLKASLICSASFCPAEETGLSFPSFMDKTLLCGSHIRNASIHLTQSEKEFLQNPVIYGVYYGDGDTEIDINLGFEPKAVKVFADNKPPVCYENSLTCLYSASAYDNKGTTGLEITSTGFTAKSGATHQQGNAVPYLDKAGVTYWYEAMA